MNARTAPLSAGYGIRCARPTESGAIAALLARAFTDDPVTAWMFPDPSDRERRTSRFFTRLQRQQRPRAGGVRVAATAEGQLLAAALWSGPGRWKPSAVRELAALPHYARVFGTDGLRRAADVENSLQEAHPEVPHWYLPTLGTDPAVQGAGAGSALVRQQTAHCDRLGRPAYLESSKPSNVPFYERHGFRVTREVRLPDGGPTLWAMWRDPAADLAPGPGGPEGPARQSASRPPEPPA
ncbi:GNAT family N-acetyltransferase [Streptomyces antarcticus]|uniref:GNAT family N-acetyltransferase n=1 Tax=Streptomyces antarcticus TaxID=2996458 RepID=UPI002271C490|nr:MULTISPECIES: GNAT family N-acetyltransferase [unclassified Streptomyces]MCY0943840.1 GNAT family N-acetyltransferase [Streptomyces sp. H34-AA3]MCZ4085702.1 GNAT family N-acetyltransferase [Streptomyces sp. H34-S5]